jgi:hypothetical protein
LEGVAFVNPVPDTDDSTCEVYLKDEGLPDLERWNEQFRKIVNGTYEMRGVEVTLKGLLKQEAGDVLLDSSAARPAVRLRPLEASQKIQWNHVARQRKPLEPEEAEAFNRFAASVDAERRYSITGTLESTAGGYELHVRSYSEADSNA